MYSYERTSMLLSLRSRYPRFLVLVRSTEGQSEMCACLCPDGDDEKGGRPIKTLFHFRRKLSSFFKKGSLQRDHICSSSPYVAHNNSLCVYAPPTSLLVDRISRVQQEALYLFAQFGPPSLLWVNFPASK